jgi:16S rRNA (cytosine967-C5)-methyltransferase
VDARKPGPPRTAPRSSPIATAREAALRLLVELEAGNFPAGGRIEQLEASLPTPEERRFFHNLVHETLRHRLRLDHVIEGLLMRQRLADLPPAIRNILRLGACQCLRMQSIPVHAVVNTSVDLARFHGHRGTTGLVNAVLRRLSREGMARWAEAGGEAAPGAQIVEQPAEDESTRGAAAAISADSRTATTPAPSPAPLSAETLSTRYSHPLWLVERWMRRWGAERTERLLRWNNTLPDYWLRLREGRDPPPGSTPGWIPGTARLAAGSNPAEVPGFREGAWTIQDGSGILVGFIPPEVRGLVLDLCAAPGSKTTHLLERARGSAGAGAERPPAGHATRILALDRSAGRLNRLRRGLTRLDPALSAEAPRAPVSIHPVAADSRAIPVRAPWNGALLDAPCSNLGVLRRRVDLKWRASEAEIRRLARAQAELLDAAAIGVVLGGWLVYSVCTLEPEETFLQRDRFLRVHKGWQPLVLPEVIPPEVRHRTGEMILIPGELETDGTYAFAVRKHAELSPSVPRSSRRRSRDGGKAPGASASGPRA